MVTEEQKIHMLQELESSIVNGFQLAASSGPLCEEPMMGVCFIIDDVVLKKRVDGNADNCGPFTGQIMSATKEACRHSFLSRSTRLREPMYLCDLQVPSEAMGKAYTVLGKRRAKILGEEIKEGSICAIQALLPVVESFGLSVEMLTHTSGAASTQLVFSDWEILDQDPYFVSTTEEELEDIGENLGSIAPNIARQLMDSVRNRKGLHVEEKIVKRASAQRTLKKKK